MLIRELNKETDMEDGYHPNHVVPCRAVLNYHTNTLKGTSIQKVGIKSTPNKLIS